MNCNSKARRMQDAVIMRAQPMLNQIRPQLITSDRSEPVRLSEIPLAK
jgi:hypothetical protein